MSQRRLAEGLADDEVEYFDIIGADGGDNENDDDDDDADDSNGDDDNDDDDDEEETVESLKEKLAAAEAARLRAERRMKNADKAKTKEVQKRQALENAGKPEVDVLKEENERLKAELADKTKIDPKTVLLDGFRDLEEFRWHDRKLAFSQLDLSEIEIDENGEYDADELKDAVEELAKKRPYLLKTSEKSDDDEDDEPEPKPKSGNNPSRRRNQQNTDKAAAVKKFPILSSRS